MALKWKQHLGGRPQLCALWAFHLRTLWDPAGRLLLADLLLTLWRTGHGAVEQWWLSIYSFWIRTTCRHLTLPTATSLRFKGRGGSELTPSKSLLKLLLPEVGMTWSSPNIVCNHYCATGRASHHLLAMQVISAKQTKVIIVITLGSLSFSLYLNMSEYMTVHGMCVCHDTVDTISPSGIHLS